MNRRAHGRDIEDHRKGLRTGDGPLRKGWMIRCRPTQRDAAGKLHSYEHQHWFAYLKHACEWARDHQ